MASRKKSPRLNSLALAKLRESWNQDRTRVTRRSFVVGSASALMAPVAAKAAGGSSLLGGFKVRTRRGRKGQIERVAIEINKDASWTVDAAWLEGSPRLELEKTDRRLTVKLTGARYPGTKFNLNFVAEIEPKLTEHSVEIRFFDTGASPTDFTVSGPLEKWILGATALGASLPASSVESLFGAEDLANHTGVRVEGDANVSFTPSNGFRVVGPAAITTPDAHYEVSDFAVEYKPRSLDTLVGGTTKAATVIEANRRGLWDHSVEAQSQTGWRLTGTTSGFDRLTSESHETGVTGLVLTGSGALVAKIDDDVAFPVEDSQLAQLYGSEPSLVFSGKLADSETWVHRPGLSAKLAPGEGVPFVIGTDRSGVLVGEPRIEARQVVPKIDDAIVTVRSDADSFPVSFGQQRVTPIRRPVVTPPAVTPPVVQKPAAVTAQATTVATGVPIDFYINFFATLDVVRVADMLSLSFELVNLSITSTGTTSQIATTNQASPSYMVVEFPPQSLAEETFGEVAVPTVGFEGLPTTGFSTPIKTRLSNVTRLAFEIPRTAQIANTLEGAGGLLDWSGWFPSVAPTAISSYAPAAGITIDPTWTNPVVLSTGASDMDAVLQNLTPQPKILFTRKAPVQGSTTNTAPAAQVATAVVKPVPININTTKVMTLVPTKRIPVTAFQTWIEMPAWLAISPPETAVWIHSPAPTANAPTPIWNTRLAYGTAKSPLWTSDDGKWFYVPSSTGFSGPFSSPIELHPTVRAVDAFDYSSNPNPPADSWFTNAATQTAPAMTPQYRSSLVDGMTPRSTVAATDSPAFNVENLVLTSLGGFLRGDWNYPNAPVDQRVIGWKHIATLGRDQYVRLTERGFLYPFMHKAVLVTISERKFDRDPGTGNVYAVMRQRQFVMITQPTVVYSADVAQCLGFTQITCLSKSTQNLETASNPNIFWMETTNNAPALVTLRGIDFDGNPITWDQECGFVYYATGLNASLQGSILSTLATIPGGPSDLGGQLITFAPVNPTATTPQTTHFPCMNITFGGEAGTTDGKTTPCFRPTLKSTSIRVSAVETMQSGSSSPPSGPVTAQFADVYRQYGFGANNPSETLFAIPTPAPAKFGNLKTSGGLVNPDMPMGAISRKQGPLPQVPSSAGTFPVSAYTPGGASMSQLSAKILGAVSIWDIIPSTINVGGNGTDAPKITLSKVYSTSSDASSPGQDGSLASAVGSVSGILGANAPQVPSMKDVIGAKVEFKWTPKLSNWGLFPKTNPLPIFVATPVQSIFSAETSTFGTDPTLSSTPPNTATFTVDAWFEEIFTKGGTNDPAVGSHYNLTAELLWFRVNAVAGVWSVIFVDVQRVGFYASDGQNPQVKIDIPAITFTGCLSFVQTLENWLGGGTNDVHFPTPDSAASSSSSNLLASTDGYMLDDGPGFTPIMQVTDANIEVGGTLTIPDISVGMFSLSNISFTGTINLPFLGPSLAIGFSFCTQDKPFLLSVDGIAGGGFFAITLVPSGLQTIQASLEFGASISINLGVASGGVSLMAGIYFEYDAPTSTTTLTGFVRLQGNLTIIEIISMSLEFYLSLTYTDANGVNSVTGTCTMTVEVSILFFSVGVSVSVTKTFGGASGGGSSNIGHSDFDALTASNDGGLPAPPGSTPFTQGVSQAQWAYYCSSFAGAN